MNLKQIEAFVKIANNKSFSLTAKEMFLTQPTVSAAIKTLEDELGLPLFVRSTRGVELTEGGKQIFLYARQMLEAASAIRMISVENMNRDEINYELVISASTIPAQFLLPDLMASFSTYYPETQFRVSVSDSEQVAKEIEDHKADIGLCGSAPSGKTFTCIPFYQDELVVVTPNTERYRKLTTISPLQWISSEPMILREEGSGTKTEALAYLNSMGIDISNLNIVVRIGNSGAILNAVRKGLGITILSRLAVKEDLEAGRVMAFPLAEKGYYRSIYVISNSLFPQTENVKRFIRFVQRYYSVERRNEQFV